MVMADLMEGHPISEKKMKEVLGHTPVQVHFLHHSHSWEGTLFPWLTD